MKTIKCIVKRPNSKPYYTSISNSLESLQAFVGGYIEVVPFFGYLAVICNKEGLLQNLDYNCNIAGIDFVGPIIIVGRAGEELENIPVGLQRLKWIFPELWEVK